MPELNHHHHHQAEGERSSSAHNLEELFESARSLWDEGELKKSWGVYEHICHLLRPDTQL